ncbi:MAG: hypothetical protein Fues2KO_52110 [Fuerstiella sp.]
MTGGQLDLILDLQKRNGLASDHALWHLMFHKMPKPNQANASTLIEYLLDLDAVRRKSGRRWAELQAVQLIEVEGLREIHPKRWGHGQPPGFMAAMGMRKPER